MIISLHCLQVGRFSTNNKLHKNRSLSFANTDVIKPNVHLNLLTCQNFTILPKLQQVTNSLGIISQCYT